MAGTAAVVFAAHGPLGKMFFWVHWLTAVMPALKRAVAEPDFSSFYISRRVHLFQPGAVMVPCGVTGKETTGVPSTKRLSSRTTTHRNIPRIGLSTGHRTCSIGLQAVLTVVVVLLVVVVVVTVAPLLVPVRPPPLGGRVPGGRSRPLLSPRNQRISPQKNLRPNGRRRKIPKSTADGFRFSCWLQ